MTLYEHFHDENNLPYHHLFAYLLTKILLIASVFFFSINIFLSLVIQSKLKRYNTQNQSLVNIVEKLNIYNKLNIVSHNHIGNLTNPIVAIILETLNIIIFWLVIIPFMIALISYSVFDLISPWFCGTVILFLGKIALIFQAWRHSFFQKKDTFQERFICALKRFRILLGVELGFLIFFSIFFPFAFQNGCLCNYNTGYGIETVYDFQFSTKWTRSNWVPDEVCKKMQLCHIYATLPEQTESEVFINVHAGIDIQELRMEMKSNNNKISFDCEKIPFPSKIEDRGQRNVFTCLGLELQAYTLYEIDLIHKDKILNSTKYKTIAEKSSYDDLVILFGGDWGYREKGLQIVDQISQVNPDAILIGGDIAYDNGNIHCYYSFDLLLQVFEQQFQKIDRTIPFIFSVGNHDVGFNDYAFYNITVSNERGPLYFTYFPQRKSQDNKTLPIKNRVTYNVHKMQNIQLFGLDSGYLYSHGGEQANWLIQILNNQKQDYLNFAHYHNPIYPSCFDNNSFVQSWTNIIRARNIWVRLFDEYEFAGAFENHVHQFKRTFPLKNSTRSEKGTVYFGDGSMGVSSENCPDQQKTYLTGMPFENLFEAVLTNDSSHFWVLRSFGTNKTITFNAFQPDNKFIQNSSYSITFEQEKNKKIIIDL